MKNKTRAIAIVNILFVLISFNAKSHTQDSTKKDSTVITTKKLDKIFKNSYKNVVSNSNYQNHLKLLQKCNYIQVFNGQYVLIVRGRSQ